MMASHHHHHDALWAKLHALGRQLATHKLLRAPRGDDVGADTALWETCRGSQYETYMRRRDARREAASAPQQHPAVGSRSKPMSPRCTVKAARDGHEVKRTPAMSVPSTPRRRDSAAVPRIKTVSGGATGIPARPPHQRRSSLGSTPTDFGDSVATPRPFLKSGTGTGSLK